MSDVKFMSLMYAVIACSIVAGATVAAVAFGRGLILGWYLLVLFFSPAVTAGNAKKKGAAS